jgi:hypothetical protein
MALLVKTAVLVRNGFTHACGHGGFTHAWGRSVIGCAP